MANTFHIMERIKKNRRLSDRKKIEGGQSTLLGFTLLHESFGELLPKITLKPGVDYITNMLTFLELCLNKSFCGFNCRFMPVFVTRKIDLCFHGQSSIPVENYD